MPILAANQAVLLKKFPVVLERIIAVGNRMPDSYFYESKDGVETLMVQRGEHSYCPYGSFNKFNLIKRWQKSLRVAPESLYAITGFGDGSHLEYFMKESASGTYVLAAEKDPALLRETLSRFDLSELLNNERFLLSVGELMILTMHIFKMPPLREFRKLIVWYFRHCIQLMRRIMIKCVMSW